MGFFQLFKKKSLSAIARKEGYVTDQKGIQNRYIRESELWKSHLENTKKFILESVDNCASKKSIAILGSGWLLDVPIQELSKQFEHVYLCDVVHPEQIVVNMKKYTNVELVTVDLTGGLIQLAENVTTFDSFCQGLQSIPVFTFENLAIQPDLVVSVNLLNQLDIILCDFLQKKFFVKEQDLQQVRGFIQQRHIDCLPHNKTCLITDYVEENHNVETKQVTTKNLLFCKLPKSLCEQKWDWNFDASQKYHDKCNTILKVKALRF